MAKRPTKEPSQHAPLDQGALPWLLAAALAAAAPHASHLPFWLCALAGCLLLWRAYLWLNNAPLPSRWLLALLVAAGVAGIGWQFRTLFGRDSGVALLFLFMALKPMEMRTRRDAMVVVMLGFFLLLTHYFYSQSIPTGLWLLAASTVLIATLIRIHGGAQPVGAIVRYAGSLLAQAVPFMIIAFLLFPRISGPLWGLPQDAYSGLTGLSDQMSPGSLNNLIQSGAIAFRVQFKEQTPPKPLLYWRGPVLTDYDGRTWRARAPNTAAQGKPPVIEATGKPVNYVTTLEAHNQRWLLALDMPVKFPDDTRFTSTFELRAKEPVVARTRYTISSTPGFVANREETQAVLQQALRLPPEINPRSRDLADDWRATLKSPEKISSAALQFFREEAFYYTLRPPFLGEQAVNDFLFNTRRGFCEHYASAYVFLMRAAGVPARVVTGYQGGEINPVDGYLVVRQSDAHAWAEIWLANRGWVRVNPTAAVAPSRIEQGIDAALPAGDPLPVLVRIDANWLRDLRNQWEAINNSWNQWVLGYNPQRQRELLSRLGLGEPDWRNMTAVLATLSGIALLAVSLWTLYQRNTDTPAQRAWQAFCRQLARRGIRRANWEGPLDFAARVARERPAFSVLTREAAGLFAVLHYGKGRPEQLQQLKQCTRRLKKNSGVLTEKQVLNKRTTAHLFLTLSLICATLCPITGHAAKNSQKKIPPLSSKQEVQAFIVEMHEQHGFDIAHLTRQFAAIHSNATVLRAIRPAAVPEQQRSWERYCARFVNERRINNGLVFWQENAAELARAEAFYGVPAEIITAIIGVETEYGRNMGKFSVLEALATLAFDYPPRAPFFRSELEQFLLLARENGISPLEIKGSYAGAIGIPQFMPSSQRRFAVDFDGDDRINLRESNTDAIGSVARYLAMHGWQAKAPVAVPARVEGDPTPLIAAGIKPTLPLKELARQGVIAVGDPERPAALIDLVTPSEATEYWVGFDNFYAITRYNRSSFYAMSVFQLAEALKKH